MTPELHHFYTRPKKLSEHHVDHGRRVEAPTACKGWIGTGNEFSKTIRTPVGTITMMVNKIAESQWIYSSKISTLDNITEDLVSSCNGFPARSKGRAIMHCMHRTYVKLTKNLHKFPKV